ncbi:MAG: hypothetical protein ACOC7J_03295 [Armatimonadota bacterium]
MRIFQAMTLAVVLTASSPGWPAEPATGRHDVLLDLHGYNHAGSVVVPLAPLVHWLGATVSAVGEWTTVSRGEHVVYLKLPESRTDGHGALVHLRDIAETLGAELRYHGWDSDEAAMLGHIAHAELIDGDRTARVLLHAAPPGVVSEVLADVERGDRCTGFLLRVSAVAGEWAKTHEPQWHEQFGFEQQYVTGVLHRVEGRWQYALRTTKVSHTPEELAEAGVPVEVARALGMEIEG